MQPKDKKTELLFQLLQKDGMDVAHLPYTPAFEDVCSANQAASVGDKHNIWEQLLELQSRVQADEPPANLTSARSETLANAAAPISLAAPAPRSQVPSPGFRKSLFEDESVQAAQPWTAPSEARIPPEFEERRDRLLAGIADSRLGTMEQRVAFLLQRFPETRESYTALCIRYWRRFQADVLERWRPLELEVLFELDRLETIGRLKREIQNKLQLFRGKEDTAQYRDSFQRELHEYLASHRDTIPEIRFYLDETGNEGDKAYTGVAGLCMLSWQQYEMHYAAIAKWRREQNWPENIHFSETGSDRLDRAVSLLGQLAKRRSGLLFLGYAVSSRGRTHEDLFSLLIQLVIDSLHHLKRNGCLNEPRSLRVVKEADPGFDNLFLLKMHKQLSDLVALEFPGQVIVQPIEPVAKGREVFLECADLIAGGMQRRALMKGRNPKDKLAEAVFNVTGFEDAADGGAVFKFYPSHS